MSVLLYDLYGFRKWKTCFGDIKIVYTVNTLYSRLKFIEKKYITIDNTPGISKKTNLWIIIDNILEIVIGLVKLRDLQYLEYQIIRNSGQAKSL